MGSTEESAPLLPVSRSGPLGNVQITSNSNSTSRERKVNPMTEELSSFILFASGCPQ
ncbi:S100 calcium binding protein A10 (calpactin), isoform CRA_b [Rattus norvegicus]|uniref:S100 calcium binding protein A10 (Calpactin), isoform CRA_b n=1 Tax=Rattus norvegicus TaxID=10116 RepID=A6KMM0_RAT|nr:S100 calcium binding protein A10 (calpactin), isoform CRA_b [Rattus norvegicus]